MSEEEVSVTPAELFAKHPRKWRRVNGGWIHDANDNTVPTTDSRFQDVICDAINAYEVPESPKPRYEVLPSRYASKDRWEVVAIPEGFFEDKQRAQEYCDSLNSREDSE